MHNRANGLYDLMDLLQTSKEDLECLHSSFESFITSKTIPSLSLLLGEPIEYNLRKIREVNISDLDDLVPPFDDAILMSAVYVKCEGDLSMAILLYLPEKSAKRLAAKLLGKNKLSKLSRVGRSSISEIGNILAASIFNAISYNTGFQVVSSVPGFAMDTYRTLLEQSVLETANDSPTVIVGDLELVGVSSKTSLHILLLQDVREIKKLLMKN